MSKPTVNHLWQSDANFSNGSARIECTGEGGTTIEMLDFRGGVDGTLDFGQQTITWH